MFVPIPDVDRGRADFRNIKAVVIEADDSCNYKLGTEHGVLSQMYVRSQFEPSVEKLFNVPDVITERSSKKFFNWIGPRLF